MLVIVAKLKKTSFDIYMKIILLDVGNNKKN